MHAERDYLRSHVFPALAESLGRDKIHIDAIDLRWGVDTSVSDHDRDLIVLKVCLREVNRCLPFIIGVIGDRYGTILPDPRLADAAREAGFLLPTEGKSVTGLEIEFGALSRPEQAKAAFFYLRDPLPYERMSPHLAAFYSDCHDPQPGAALRARKLSAMKQRLQAELPGQTRRYSVSWDDEAERVVGLEQFGEMVIADLHAAVLESQEDAPASAADWRDTERWVLESFVEDRARVFVGREQEIRDLHAFATGPDSQAGRGRCLIGDAGMGKSAVFAQCYRSLAADDGCVLLAHAAGVGPRSTEVSAMLDRWSGELARLLGREDTTAEDDSDNAVEERFSHLLQLACERMRVIVLIDALEQFEPGRRSRYLSWLPAIWPANARFIATSQPGWAERALAHRPDIHAVRIGPLSRSDAREIVRQVCAGYGRVLGERAVAALLARATPSAEMSAANPLWLHLALEELNLLDEDDFRRVDAAGGDGAPISTLNDLLVAEARSYPGTVDEMYRRIIERGDHVYGPRRIVTFLLALAVSRNGLREQDLNVVLPQLSGQPWSQLQFAAVRRGLRRHVIQGGYSGEWLFSHRHMQRVVLDHIGAAGERTIEEAHLAIAHHLRVLARDDPVRVVELMYHLIGTGNPRNVSVNFARMKGVDLHFGVRAVADHIAQRTAAFPDDARQWVRDVLADHNIGWEHSVRLCQLFMEPVSLQLSNMIDVADQLWLTQIVADRLEELLEQAPDNADCMNLLAIAFSSIAVSQGAIGQVSESLDSQRRSIELSECAVELGELTMERAHALVENQRIYSEQMARDARGDYSQSLVHARKALETCRRMLERFPHNPTLTKKLGLVMSWCAQLTGWTEGPESAIPLAEEAIKVLEHLEPLDHLTGRNGHALDELATAYRALGEVLKEAGDFGGALAAHQKALARFERTLAAFPQERRVSYWMSGTLMLIGRLQADLGDAELALTTSQRALKTIEALQDDDPRSSEYTEQKYALLYGLRTICEQAEVSGRLEPLLLEALERTERRYQRHPAVASARDLAETYVFLALDANDRKSEEEIGLWFRRAHNVMKAWSEQGQSLGPNCDAFYLGIREGYEKYGDTDLVPLDSVPRSRGGTALPGTATTVGRALALGAAPSGGALARCSFCYWLNDKTDLVENFRKKIPAGEGGIFSGRCVACGGDVMLIIGADGAIKTMEQAAREMNLDLKPEPPAAPPPQAAATPGSEEEAWESYETAIKAFQDQDYGKATSFFMAAGAWYGDQQPDSAEHAAIVSNLGICHNRTAAYDSALECFFRAQAMTSPEAQPAQYGTILNNIGAAYLKMRDFANAEAFHLQALEFHLSHGSDPGLVRRERSNLVFVYNEMAAESASADDLNVALGASDQAMIFCRDGPGGDTHRQTFIRAAAIRRDLARARAGEHQFEQALKLYREALGLLEEVGAAQPAEEISVSIAELVRAGSDPWPSISQGPAQKKGRSEDRPCKVLGEDA